MFGFSATVYPYLMIWLIGVSRIYFDVSNLNWRNFFANVAALTFGTARLLCCFDPGLQVWRGMAAPLFLLG